MQCINETESRNKVCGDGRYIYNPRKSSLVFPYIVYSCFSTTKSTNRPAERPSGETESVGGEGSTATPQTFGGEKMVIFLLLNFYHFYNFFNVFKCLYITVNVIIILDNNISGPHQKWLQIF